jgi:hypothetical protein
VGRVVVDEAQLTNTEILLFDYTDPRLNSSLYYVDLECFPTPDEDGEYDFGFCVCGSGQLFIDDELIVDNASKQRQGTAFIGLGIVKEIGTKALKAGQTYQSRPSTGRRQLRSKVFTLPVAVCALAVLVEWPRRKVSKPLSISPRELIRS